MSGILWALVMLCAYSTFALVGSYVLMKRMFIYRAEARAAREDVIKMNREWETEVKSVLATLAEEMGK